MAKKTYQRVRGTRDILPDEQAYFDFIEKNFFAVATSAGFQKITTPVFEDTGLFVRGVGKGTDVIEKEMYTFMDKSGNNLSLRPEGTAPIVRAYLENGMQAWSQPVKLFYVMPMFRYERPQAGRYREHWQFGLELIGDKEPMAEVLLIHSILRLYDSIGIRKHTSLQLNSIGCRACRPKYIKELKNYYKDNLKKVCPDCKKRYELNPLRLLDCKDDKCQPVIEEAPQIINHLDKPCHEHFKTVLELLDDLNIGYEINPKLVRGFDYYTRTVFEFWGESGGSRSSLGGGGRYDDLVEDLGGKSTPALGFAGGIDRTIEEIKIHPEIELPSGRQVDIYVAQIGDSARKCCLKLLSGLWSEQLIAEGCLDKGGISQQLSTAAKLKAKYTLIIGQKEAFDNTVIIKEMISGNQEIYPQEGAIKEIKKRL